MEISLRLTQVPPYLIKTLISNGIVLVSHLASFTKLQLAAKTKLSLAECDQILNLIKPKRPHFIFVASDLMISKFDYIRTTLEDLDYALGGGIRCGRLTEISGEAGTGKSNLCCHLALVTALPIINGGLNGDILILHTEGEGKLKLALKRFNSLSASMPKDYHLENRLHVKDCCNVFEFMEMVNRLPMLVDQMQNVKLVILDSITCAFMCPDEKPDLKFYRNRSAKLTKLTKIMNQLAWDKQLAIVMTNHVTFNPDIGCNRPALGKLWSHMCQTKICLKRIDHGSDQARRYAYVTKGAIHSIKPTRFEITDTLFTIN